SSDTRCRASIRGSCGFANASSTSRWRGSRIRSTFPSRSESRCTRCATPLRCDFANFLGPLPTRVSVRTVETPRTARWNALARGALQRAWQWIARNAYLGLVVGALLVITRTVTFTPPNEVRVGTTDAGQVV